jgi:hypothetical protein
MRLQRRRRAVEYENQRQPVLGDQPRRPVEEAGQVRRRAAGRIAQRRPVAQADQRKELVELTVAVDGEPPAA